MMCSNYNGKECTETRSQYYMCDCDGADGQDCEYNTNRSLKDIFYQILETQEEIDDLNGEIGELECDIITKTNLIKERFTKYGIQESYIKYHNEDMDDHIPFLEIACNKEQAIKIINENEFEKVELRKTQSYNVCPEEYTLFVEYPEYYR